MERHNERRSKLCVVCCSHAKQMTPKFANLVETFLIEGYSVIDIRLPSGLCSTCRSHLGRIDRGHFKYSLPNFFDYSDMVSYRIPRHGECNCIRLLHQNTEQIRTSKRGLSSRQTLSIAQDI